MLANIFSIGLGVAFAATFTGKGVMSVFMGVFAITSLVMIARAQSWKTWTMKAWPVELLLVMGVFASWLVSSYLAINTEESFEQTFKYTAIMVAGFALYRALVLINFDMVLFGKTVAIGCGLCGVLAVYHAYNPTFPGSWARSSYSSVLAMAIPFALYTAIHAQRKPAILYWAAVVAICAGSFALGGRTGYVALVCAVLLFAVLFPWKEVTQKYKAIGLTLILPVVGAVAGLNAYRAFVGEALYNARVATIDMNRPASGRLDIWRDAIAYIVERPFFGYGLDGFNDMILRDVPDSRILHPHNIVIELLCGTGVVGLGLFAALILWFVWKFVCAYRATMMAGRGIYMAAFIGFAAYGIASLALTSIFHGWWFLYGLLFVVILAYGTRVLRATV